MLPDDAVYTAAGVEVGATVVGAAVAAVVATYVVSGVAGAGVAAVVAGVVLVVLWVHPAKSAAARRSAKIMLMSASLLGVNLPFITFTIR
jgi:hypothetical protein